MMVSSDFRTDARRKLDGKWGKAALISLAYMVICFVIGFIQGLLPDSMQFILSIIVWIIEVPLAFGLIISLFKLFNGENVKAFDFLESGFNNFKRSWSVTFQTVLKMIVPVILIIVSIVLIAIGTAGAITSSATSFISSSKASASMAGGFGVLGIIGFILYIVSIIWAIMKSYYYQLSILVAIDNPEISAKEAVQKSEELMKNKRAKLFCLQFSFIGWAILAIFTLGIGYLWLLPYIQFATISFYKNTLGQNVEVETKE